MALSKVMGVLVVMYGRSSATEVAVQTATNTKTLILKHLFMVHLTGLGCCGAKLAQLHGCLHDICDCDQVSFVCGPCALCFTQLCGHRLIREDVGVAVGVPKRREENGGTPALVMLVCNHCRTTPQCIRNISDVSVRHFSVFF